MYKFNNFQYETYAEELLDIVVKNKEEYINIIKEIAYENDACMDADPNYHRNMIAAGVGTITGDVTSIIAGIINKSSFGSILSTAAIVTMCGIISQVILTIVSAKKIIKETDEFAENCYKTIVNTLKETIKEPKKLTDEDIYQMTYSIRNGEMDEKFDLTDGTKLDITVIEFKSFDQWIVETLQDYNLTFLYERLLHISNMAYEGYEEDIKSAYSLIKEYIHAKKDKEHFNKNYYLDKFAYYSKKCASMAKSRK